MSAASTVGATEAPSGLRRWVPGAEVLRTYQRSWLPRDLVAGLVLTALLVPAGMGYAEASGLPAIYGLYATVVPLVVYALAGPTQREPFRAHHPLPSPQEGRLRPAFCSNPTRSVASTDPGATPPAVKSQAKANVLEKDWPIC